MRILLNSAVYETTATDLETLKRERNFGGEICIINGFSTNENAKISNGDEIFLIKKGESPTNDELKALMVSRNAPNVNKALQNSRVAVCGLGGLGSNVAIFLARAGVAELFLIDFDIVEPTNLNRQQYELSDLYKPKTQALKDRISRINPFVKVETLNEKLNPQNIGKILKNERIICECFDNPAAKAMILDVADDDRVLILASGMAGFGEANLIKTRKFAKNVYICGDETNGATQNVGLVAPRVGVCAAHQATLALRAILGELE